MTSCVICVINFLGDKKMIEFRSAYSPRLRVALDQSIPDPKTGEIQVSMTKQEFAQETEINNIMARYEKTGILDHVKEHAGYANFPAPVDYQDALQMTIDAQLAFDALPARTRREFHNDPLEFLSFIEDPDNVDRMRDLGLLNDPVEEASEEADPSPREVPPEAAA
ncbi:portal protein [Marine gokushovirus]|nr:portal protein [Marine gokushovirus]